MPTHSEQFNCMNVLVGRSKSMIFVSCKKMGKGQSLLSSVENNKLITLVVMYTNCSKFEVVIKYHESISYFCNKCAIQASPIHVHGVDPILARKFSCPICGF